MRKCIKQPIPEVHAAIQAIIDAVNAHILGDSAKAATKFKEANCQTTWEWLNEPWSKTRKNVVFLNVVGDSQVIPKSERDPDRIIKMAIRRAVLARDGHTCRYCGLPVIHADIRKISHKLYPEEIPWNSRKSTEQHSGFQVSWLQFDHVKPHSHGGTSTLDNIVVSCALCNFGKDSYTIKQLDLEDPRLRAPIPSNFDGLERLRAK